MGVVYSLKGPKIIPIRFDEKRMTEASGFKYRGHGLEKCRL